MTDGRKRSGSSSLDKNGVRRGMCAGRLNLRFEDIMVSVADQGELVAPAQPLWITVLLWVYLAGVAATLFQTVWVGLPAITHL